MMIHVGGPIEEFISKCDEVAGLSDETYDVRFHGEMTYGDKLERVLHSYIWFKRKEILPDVNRILLHERPIDREMLPNNSEADFVFESNEGSLILVEVKWMRHDNTADDGREMASKNVRVRRSKKRKKVIEQLGRHLGFLSDIEKGWGIPLNRIEPVIVTNDENIKTRRDFIERGYGCEVVSDEDLQRFLEDDCVRSTNTKRSERQS